MIFSPRIFYAEALVILLTCWCVRSLVRVSPLTQLYHGWSGELFLTVSLPGQLHVPCWPGWTPSTLAMQRGRADHRFRAAYLSPPRHGILLACTASTGDGGGGGAISFFDLPKYECWQTPALSLRKLVCRFPDQWWCTSLNQQLIIVSYEEQRYVYFDFWPLWYYNPFLPILNLFMYTVFTEKA